MRRPPTSCLLLQLKNKYKAEILSAVLRYIEVSKQLGAGLDCLTFLINEDGKADSGVSFVLLKRLIP